VNLHAIFSRRRLAVTALVIVAGAAAARLGIWQLDRLQQRRAFNAHVISMRHLPSLTLPVDDPLESQEYRSVQARGTFDFDHQVALRNQVHEGQYGFHLITPLRMEDPSNGISAILVDRGWIPAAGNEQRQAWHRYDVGGTVQVQGVIRLGRGETVLANNVQSAASAGSVRDDFWLFVDVEQISRQVPYRVMPIYMQLDGLENSKDLPAAVAPRLDLGEGPHLGYAIQWFGLSAVLVVGYVMYVSKKEAA